MMDTSAILEKMRYPRPQMVRDNYRILNDGWTLDKKPIQLPFPPQAAASGYMGEIGDDLCYELRFSLRLGWHNQNGEMIPYPLRCSEQEGGPREGGARGKRGRILLHFGAVDQYCLVFLNDRPVGSHKGGYLPFTCDITDALGEDNVLRVLASDSLSWIYPYGKQSKKPKGMWYTPVSGIWQDVWMEAVPDRYVDRVLILPDQKGALVRAYDVRGDLMDIDRISLSPSASRESGFTAHPLSDGSVRLDMEDPHLWSPEDPYLYWLCLQVGEDRIKTYLGLRTISMEGGKVCCNGKAVYLHGLLDQGYWPEGIYLPAGPEGYLRDIRGAMDLGFNCLRKHIKVEADRFYYACDAMGMLVLQDMVNSGKYDFMRDTVLPNYGKQDRLDDPAHALRLPGEEEEERRAFFEQHVTETIDQVRNHPSIIGYTIFNEGWGQYDADRLYQLVKGRDPDRLVDATSGWYAQKLSDFDSQHNYHRSFCLRAGDKPLFLSECGGYTLAVAGHCMRKKRYGYGTDKKSSAELQEAIERLYRDMIIPAIESQGLVGSIYTQISDVEGEINGLFTYDRAVCKPDRGRMRKLADELEAAFRQALGEA